MIIGTREVDLQRVIKLKDTPELLYKYVESLVPELYKHVPAIVHNQRYYIGTLILQDKHIPMNMKREINDILVKNVHVNGYLGVFIDCNDLEGYINMNVVQRYLKGDLNEH